MGLFGLSLLPDVTDLFGGGSMFKGGIFGGTPTSKANWIKEGYAPAFGEIRGGTAAASDLLRRGYEAQFRGAAEGAVGGFDEMSSRIGAEGASNGLSPDVLQRLLYSSGMDLQSHLGELRGASEFGLDTDLAELLKGTGTELAGLTRDQLATMANYMAALKGAKATERAGLFGGVGGLIGGIVGGAG